MSLPLDAFRWQPPELIAESLIPPLVPPLTAATADALHLALLNALAEPDRWCPPDDEPRLVEALLAALRQMPGFPRELALHATSRPTDALPAALRARRGLVITGGIGHPTHTFSVWWLADGRLSRLTPNHPAPNGLFDVLAQVLTPWLSVLLASEATRGSFSIRLRAATVKQLAAVPGTCNQLFGIELPRLDGLLPIGGHLPPQGSRLLDDTLLRRIQEASPVLLALFRNRYETGRALGLPLRSLDAHLDTRLHPIERLAASRHRAGVPSACGSLPAVRNIANGRGSMVRNTPAAGDRADALGPPEGLAAPDGTARADDPSPTARRPRR